MVHPVCVVIKFLREIPNPSQSDLTGSRHQSSIGLSKIREANDILRSQTSEVRPWRQQLRCLPTLSFWTFAVSVCYCSRHILHRKGKPSLFLPPERFHYGLDTLQKCRNAGLLPEKCTFHLFDWCPLPYIETNNTSYHNQQLRGRRVTLNLWYYQESDVPQFMTRVVLLGSQEQTLRRCEQAICTMT